MHPTHNSLLENTSSQPVDRQLWLVESHVAPK
jgi:hypothetical protein